MKEIGQRDWLIAIHGVYGIGRKTLLKLTELFEGDYEAIRSLTYEDFLSVYHSKNGEIVYRSLLEACNEHYIIRMKEELHKANITCVTLLDDLYPDLLKETPDPPWVLYCKGNFELLSSFSLTVVGTRHPTTYGKAVTKKLVHSLVTGGATIVSGLARGIDSIAHQSALEQEGHTIAVLGCGIDMIYPPENKSLYSEIVQKGLIVSEYPPGTPPSPGLFPERNRIISGLSLGTIVIEANARSGSLITADQAIEQGRDVFAVPGPITSPRSDGPNQLIQQGAKLILDGEQILEDYPHHRILQTNETKRKKASLTIEEQSCLELLTDEPLHIEQIIERLRIPVQKVQSILVSLQIKKELIQLPGQIYRRNLG